MAHAFALDAHHLHYLDRFGAWLREPGSHARDAERERALRLLLDSSGVVPSGRAHSRPHIRRA